MVKNMLKFIKKRKYMDWDNYKERIDFLDTFYWQQSVRKMSLQNS